MNIDPVSHRKLEQFLPAYAVDGLDDDERRQVEAHLAVCDACRATLEQLIAADTELSQLFAASRPAPGFEDRILRSWRRESVRPRTLAHPALRRALSGIAAGIVLGAIGYAGGQMIDQGRLPGAAPMPGSSPRQVASADGGTSLSLWLGQSDAGVASPAPSDSPARLSAGDWDMPPASRRERTSSVARGKMRGESVVQERSVQLGNRQAPPPAAANHNWSMLGPTTDQNTDGVMVSNGAAVIAGGRVDINGRIAVTPAQDTHGASSLGYTPESAAVADLGVQEAKLQAHYFDVASFFAPNRPAVPALQQQGQDFGYRGFQDRGTTVALGDVPVLGKSFERAGRVALDDKRSGASAPADQPGTPAPAAPPTPQVLDPEPAPPPSVVQNRKIIRNGDMEFEVDSFDNAQAMISKIVTEEGGFVSSTNSEKLPNGKVRGTIVLRVAPDRLDTLVLKLRALGDLKTQKIAAQDVTKVYYDLDSELRAARAMEERMINIIKTGKGEVKDLIEAEKQLGIYREKIEKIEGELRYYNSLITLSTLSVTVYEKDIKAPAAVQVNESVQLGMESEDVEKTRTDALKAIEEFKGRVIESNLKRYDAGQMAATITAEVAPDSSGLLIDRLRQIGKVTRLDVQRSQSSQGTMTPGTPSPRVEKTDTRFAISIFNVANIAPRQTTTATLAVDDVEQAYGSILDAIRAKKGRIVSSNLNRQKPEQTTATIAFEVPTADADATLNELRRDREVMTLAVTENPDTQNVTSAKRGFSLQLRSLASVSPRETQSLTLVSKGPVSEAFQSLLADVRKLNARIVTSQFNEQDKSRLTAQVEIEVPRTGESQVQTALASIGVVRNRSVNRSTDTANTVDSKVRLQVRLVGLDQLAPARTAKLGVQTHNVEPDASQLKDLVVKLGGRIDDARQQMQSNGQLFSYLVADLPLDKADQFLDSASSLGTVRSNETTFDPQMADNPLAQAHIELTLSNATPMVGDDSGLGASFRRALSTSVRGLLWSVQAIVIGLLLVGPWALLAWGAWKLLRRRRGTPDAEPPAPEPHA